MPSLFSWKSLLAGLLQLGILTGTLSWAAVRYQAIQEARVPPVPRTEPVRVTPLYDRPELISDADLLAVLTKLRPTFRFPQPGINHVDHALRFWGVEATFKDEKCLSGEEMRGMLLDHRLFRQAWGDEAKPFLVPELRGVGFRLQEGPASSSHVDHTLASLAEVGTPLDYPVNTPQGEITLRAGFDQAFHQFSLNQGEYEWSTLAFVHYLPHVREWQTSEGELISYDRLAERIMRERLGRGSCRGQHRLQTLIVLLRVDEEHSILSSESRAEIVAYLQDVTRRLTASQSAEGYWDKSWPGPEWDGNHEMDSSLSDIQDRILTTGHVLEWLAFAPPEIHLPDESLIRAAGWLKTALLELPESQVSRFYPFLSHAGKALTLWRGQFPAEFWAAHQADRK